jgi:transketolase
MISTRESYSNTLVKLGKTNPNVVVLDADLSISTGTHKFSRLFPDRFFDVGCAEQNMVGVAAGLALEGYVPFVSTYSMFLMRAWEQIRNTIAKDNLNVKFVCTHSGLTNAADGSSHQCLEDIALMRVIPNMRVHAPCDEYETERKIEEELYLHGPCYVRLSREPTPPISMYSWDKWRNGDDAVIFSTGTMTTIAMEAQIQLSKINIKSTVVNISTIKPIDEDIIKIYSYKCKRAISIEEHSVIGGLGSVIAELGIPVKIIGTQDCFGESGTYAQLLEKHGLTVENLVKNVWEMCT